VTERQTQWRNAYYVDKRMTVVQPIIVVQRYTQSVYPRHPKYSINSQHSTHPNPFIHVILSTHLHNPFIHVILSTHPRNSLYSSAQFAVLNSLIHVILSTHLHNPFRNVILSTHPRNSLYSSAQFAVLNSLIRVIRCTQFAYPRHPKYSPT
jgi:hypothetical protein